MVFTQSFSFQYFFFICAFIPHVFPCSQIIYMRSCGELDFTFAVLEHNMVNLIPVIIWNICDVFVRNMENMLAFGRHTYLK